MKTVTRHSISIILVLTLFLAGCPKFVSNLELIVKSAELAVPVIAAAAGVPPAVTASLSAWLRRVDVAIIASADISASLGTSAEKRVQILQVWVGVAQGCQCLPPGAPTVLVNVASAVVQAIAVYLADFHPTTARDTGPAPVVVIHVSSRDRVALASIKARAVQNMEALPGAKP